MKLELAILSKKNINHRWVFSKYFYKKKTLFKLNCTHEKDEKLKKDIDGKFLNAFVTDEKWGKYTPF